MTKLWIQNSKIILLLLSIINGVVLIFQLLNKVDIALAIITFVVAQFLFISVYTIQIVLSKWLIDSAKESKLEIIQGFQSNFDVLIQNINQNQESYRELSGKIELVLSDLSQRIKSNSEFSETMSLQIKDTSTNLEESLKESKLEIMQEFKLNFDELIQRINQNQESFRELSGKIELVQSDLSQRIKSNSEFSETISIQIKDISTNLEASLKESHKAILENFSEINHSKNSFQEVKRHIDNTSDKYFNKVNHKLDIGIEKQIEIKELVKTQYNKIDALQGIYSFLEIRKPLPILHEGRISSDLALKLIEIYNDTPGNIIDIGSGASTIIMAYCIQKSGFNYKVYSIEHHPDYFAETKSLIEQHSLSDYVELFYCPIIEHSIEGEIFQWYDIANRLDRIENVSLLFVDGPPGVLQKNSRYPAVPLLKDKIGIKTKVVLDDGDREDEAEISTTWAEKHDLIMNKYESEKGYFILQRK